MDTTLGTPTPAPGGPQPRGVVQQTSVSSSATEVSKIDVGNLLVNRQRVPLTVDPFSPNGRVIAESLVASRELAVSHLYLGMKEVHSSLNQLVTSLASPTAPPQLIGMILQPDSTPAGHLQVQFNPSTLNNTSPNVIVQTDASGSFHLPLPSGMLLPVGSSIPLIIHGASNKVTVNVPSDQIASNGFTGAIVLPQFMAPLPVSILAALQAITAPLPGTVQQPPSTSTPQLAVLQMGDNDDCLLTYTANRSVDQFPFGVFYRLVEPRASIVSQVQSRPLGNNRFTFLPNYATSYDAVIAQVERDRSVVDIPGALPAIPPAQPGEGQVTYVDRVPVEQPISVDGFRDQMMGLQENGTFTADETRPVAGTLGLGYVLWMAQQWTFQGLALGNLVYSLPLAPGEQQQIAIFERVDTARVTESEFFTEEQAQQQRALADTSTQATFNSAFNETVRGRSHFETDSDSSSWGGSLIILSGGGGSSSSSGTSTQSLEGQRNTSQQAAQNTHSAAENQAQARRSAARTGIRLATASESQQVTTKVITNHNHTRALTMQYWDVERIYDVSTKITGLTLTVLVPLQLVRFMPPFQPAQLNDATIVGTRSQVLTRYSAIIKQGDVLAQALPRRFQRGLTMLLQFAADPTAGVEKFGGVAEDVIQFSLSGTFLSCEDIYITAITDRGTRVGPVKLANTAPSIPTDKFATQEQLIEWLVKQRQTGAGVIFTGALALPPSMNRASIIGFEISRRFRQVTYTLLSPATAQLGTLQTLFGVSDAWVNQALQSSLTPASTVRQTIFLSPSDLENVLGGPLVIQFLAAINEVDPVSGDVVPSSQEQYANESLQGVELPPQPYPIPARQLAPVLRYNEILEIEKMAQHVVRQTLLYSQAVWGSMSEHERATLLEAYTIGVPPGGVEDATQMIPLLNCVENRLLGFFGTCMILPFIIPEALARQGTDGEQIHPAKIQEALLAFLSANFTPPHSTIALPTRGVLGEAVLGHCPSAEKIDLTRFWNWQDSPGDTATAISPVTLPTTTPSIAAGLTAPSSLANLPSLINNVLTAPTTDTALLKALADAAASQKDFSASLTGGDQLASLITNAQNTANTARSDALKTTKELTAQAMATVGNYYGGLKGNPEAGSKAAAAVYGKGDGSSGSGATPAPGSKTGPSDTPKKVEDKKGEPGTGTTNTTGPTPTPGPPPG